MTGIAAFVKGTVPQALPPLALITLFLGLVFFLGAAVFGMLVNMPHMYPSYEVADGPTMTLMRTEKRNHSEEKARSIVAALHIKTVVPLRKGNDRKVWFLTWAQGCQILAVAAISIAVFVEIVRS
jgi:hypothetical protein